MGTVVGSPRPQPAPTDRPANIAGADRKLESAVERLAIPIGILITVVAFLRYAALASRRLWFDEVYTLTIATQPHLIDIWRAFYQAVDLQPPLFYFVTRMSWMLFGHNELALRLPEVLGILVFSLVVAMFVTHYYWANYTIYAVGGAVILTVAALDAIAPSRRVASFMLLLVALILFGLDHFYVKFDRQYMHQRDLDMQVRHSAIPPDGPLVIAGGLVLLPADV